MFSMSTGVLYAYEAEVKAVLNALLFCRELSLQELLIESHSTLTVGWINCKSNRPWKLRHDLNMIDYLLLEVNCLAVSHIYREANGVTDNLAEEGCDRVPPLW